MKYIEFEISNTVVNKVEAQAEILMLSWIKFIIS